MYQHSLQYRVLYADTDQMGYVYHGNYPKLYEAGRNEAIRALGLTYKELENTGIWMPVTQMEFKLLRPAFYDDQLTIVTSIQVLPESKLNFYTEIYNQEDKLLNAGKIILAFVDANTRKSTTAPSVLLEKLLPYFTS